MDFRRGSALGRTREAESFEGRLFFVEQVHESLFMLGGLRLLVWNDALGRREADPVAGATPRFRGNFQARLLSASHLASFH